MPFLSLLALTNTELSYLTREDPAGGSISNNFKCSLRIKKLCKLLTVENAGLREGRRCSPFPHLHLSCLYFTRDSLHSNFSTLESPGESPALD